MKPRRTPKQAAFERLCGEFPSIAPRFIRELLEGAEYRRATAQGLIDRTAPALRIWAPVAPQRGGQP